MLSVTSHLITLTAPVGLLFALPLPLHRVKAVTAEKVTVQDKKTGVIKEMPYGLCVWSTGVAPAELTKQFMAKVPEQGKG